MGVDCLHLIGDHLVELDAAAAVSQIDHRGVTPTDITPTEIGGRRSGRGFSYEHTFDSTDHL
jgi:hypothetical protein